MLSCVANRAACHLNLFNCPECVSDCEQIISALSNRKPEDGEVPEKERELIKKAKRFPT